MSDTDMSASDLYDALQTLSGVLQDQQTEAEGNDALVDELQERIEVLDNAASNVDEAIRLYQEETKLQNPTAKER